MSVPPWMETQREVLLHYLNKMRDAMVRVDYESPVQEGQTYEEVVAIRTYLDDGPRIQPRHPDLRSNAAPGTCVRCLTR
jgi:hypothetical protein